MRLRVLQKLLQKDLNPVAAGLLVSIIVSPLQAQTTFQWGGDFSDVVTTWDGSSDITEISNNCARAVVFGNPAPYRVRTRDTRFLSGPGGNTLPINYIEYTDAVGFTAVLPDDGSFQTGFNAATGGCDNVNLTLNFLSTDLASVLAGTYTSSIRIRGRLIGRNPRQTVRVAIEVEIPTQVVSTGLGTLDLGNWDGISAPTTSDSFCIGSNDTAIAPIDVTISSNNPGPGSEFRLQAAGNHIRYAMTFTAPGTGAAITSSPASPISGATWTVRSDESLNCNAEDFNIQVAPVLGDIQAATSGSYSDVLTVTVAPQ